jgi:hypothetical protein
MMAVDSPTRNKRDMDWDDEREVGSSSIVQLKLMVIAGKQETTDIELTTVDANALNACHVVD